MVSHKNPASKSGWPLLKTRRSSNAGPTLQGVEGRATPPPSGRTLGTTVLLGLFWGLRQCDLLGLWLWDQPQGMDERSLPSLPRLCIPPSCWPLFIVSSSLLISSAKTSQPHINSPRGGIFEIRHGDMGEAPSTWYMTTMLHPDTWPSLYLEFVPCHEGRFFQGISLPTHYGVHSTPTWASPWWPQGCSPAAHSPRPIFTASPQHC